MIENLGNRLKRLKMRSWRRGMKEVDLMLGPFADGHLDSMSIAEVDAYEALLAEMDQDILAWATGAADAPDSHADQIKKIVDFLEAGGASTLN